MQVEHVKVKMMGGFSVWVNGEAVIEDTHKLTKPWQLFCYLVIHREKFISNRKLISVVWGNDDDLSDPANVLKNAVYSLRKDLCGGESFTESPIVYSTGGYRFDPMVKVELDIDEFNEKYTAAKTNNQPLQHKEELYQAVLDAYKGEFLQPLEQEFWVIPISLDLKRKYVEACNLLAEILWNKGNYKRVVEITSTASSADHFDDKSMRYLFKAMDALKMYRAIVTRYSRIAQLFSGMSGAKPPQEVTDIFRSASTHINKTEQDIILIKSELTSTEEGTRPNKGSYYCTYNTLKYFTPLARRHAERNKQILVVALFTLTENKAAEAAVGVYDLTRAMTEFRVVSMNILRKSDAMARYSKNQYVMLLAVGSLDDGRLVRDRIKDYFSQIPAGKHILLDVKMTEV